MIDKLINLILLNFNMNFYFFTIYLFILIIVLSLIITEEYYSRNRKIFFIFLNISFFLISLLIEKNSILIIKDLFWSLQILNGSFILHALILNRIFYFAWKKRKTENEKKRKRWEILGFLASRISFTISIWFIIYVIRKIFDPLIRILFYKHSVLEERDFEKKNLIKIKILKYIKNIIYLIELIILSILIDFSAVFYNYSKFLLGQRINYYYEKKRIGNLLYSINYFILFYMIAYIIGIPRLYVILILYIILELWDILTFKYTDDLVKEEFEESSFWDKIKLIKNKKLVHLFEVTYAQKLKYLEKMCGDIFEEFLIFELIRFLDNLNNYWRGYLGEFFEKRGILVFLPEKIDYDEFPLRKVYKFYPWEEILISYSLLLNDQRKWLSSYIPTQKAYLEQYYQDLIYKINGDEIYIIKKIYEEIKKKQEEKELKEKKNHTWLKKS